MLNNKMLVLLFVVLLLSMSQIPAQDIYTSEQLQNHFQRTAAAYEMEAENKALTLQTKPLMNWYNSERQQDRGALYVWEQQGKPIVLASIFTYEFNSQVHCRHELISMADGPVTAKLDSQKVWSPRKMGVDWRPVETPATPSASTNRRLIEMRAIAKQFSGQLKIPNVQPSQLTFLPQPLHRYQSVENGIIDGAIFSLAVGTDPEILLVIEANGTEGKSSYRYTPLRSHYHELELKRDGKLVWTAPMEIALESTSASEKPFCDQPFFVFTPFNPLPTPEELN